MSNPDGVRWDIEPEGVRLMKELVEACLTRGVRVVLVYSPEYREMQSLTKNRQAIFEEFHNLSASYGVPLWDYSGWRYAGDTRYFTNSQHMNADGAREFTLDLAARLREYRVLAK